MATINYVEKHAKLIDEAFSAASVTERAVNKHYDFVGARTVKIHSVPTVAMGDYTPSGSSRYGTPSELEDNLQEITMVPDRAFTFTVDKGNSQDDEALNAGAALKRQIDQRIVPEVDKYRFAKMAVGASHATYGAITGTGNAAPYERVLDLIALMDDKDVPETGRLLYVTSTFYKKLKLDPNFVKMAEIGQANMVKGQVGEVENMPVFKDHGRMPAGVDCMIAHPDATTAPWKLSEYKQHVDPPGINGILVEGRNRFDAFVLDMKKDALALHRTSKITLAPTNAAGAAGKTKFTAVAGAVSGSDSAAVPLGKLCYAISSSAIAALDLGADLSATESYPELALDADITVSANDKYRVYLKDQHGKLIGESAQGTVTRGA